MADTVSLTFKIRQDGSLALIGQQAEKTAKSTDRATKATKNYNKGQKGVAQAGMNGTKAFSKMRNEIGGGGSGLVGAYAALAANVFALTALFGALSRASRAQQLEEGLLALGKASGLAMHTLANGLVEATGHAISLEESMRSVALITSAGIDPGSIERFGNVARGAALALGRDTNDAISRLTRGITKLEPELLDELGIMVRLDEASKTYADTIGKSVGELSRYEKSQAFLNATLEEGERKFGALEGVEVNVYDKLAASLANLGKQGIGGLANLLEPIVSYLSESPGALISALLLFASTISGAVMGSLSDMAESQAANTAASIDFSAATIGQATGLNSSSKTLKRYVRTLEEGGDVLGEYKKAVDGQRMSVETATAWNKAGSISQDEMNQKHANAKIIITDLAIATQQHALSQVQDASASALLKFAQGDLSGGLKDTLVVLKGVGTVMKTSILTTTSLKTAFSGLGASARALGVGLKSVGAGLMAMLGPLGIALSVFMMLKDVVVGIINFFKSDATKQYEEATEAMASAQKEFTSNLKETDAAFAGNSKMIHTLTGGYVSLSNVLSQFQSKYDKLNRTGIAASDFDEQQKAQKQLIESSGYLSDKFKEFKQKNPDGYGLLVSTKSEVELTEIFINRIASLAGNVKALEMASKNAKKGITDFLNAKKIKTDIDDVVSGLQGLTTTLLTYGDDGKTVKINPELLVDKNLGELINENLTGDMAIVYGLTEQKRVLNAEDAKRETLTKNSLTQAEELKELEFKRSYAYHHQQAALDKQIKQKKQDLATTKRGLAASKAVTQEMGSAIAVQLDAEQKKYESQQREIILNKEILGEQKAIAKVAKERENNTLKRLQDRQVAEESLLRTQISQNQSSQDRLTDLKAKYEALGEEKDRTDATNNQILRYAAEIRRLEQERLLLLETILTTEEKQVEVSKMRLNQLNEDFKGKQALLDMSQSLLKEDRAQLALQVKLSKLALKRDNRKKAVDTTESQLSAIELDEKVIRQKLDFIARESKLKIAGIRMEKAILSAKLQIIKSELQLINKKREGTAAPQISLAEINAAITDINSGSGILQEQLRTITLETMAQAEELAYQLATTNHIAMATAERLTDEIKIKDIIKEATDLRMENSRTVLSMKGTLNEIAQIKNTDLFGEPRSNIEAAKLAKEAGLIKVDAAIMAYEQAVLSHDLEMSIITAKYALMKAEMEQDGLITQNEADILNNTQAVIAAQRRQGELSIQVADKNIALVRAQTEQQNVEALGTAASKGWAAVIATSIGQGLAETENKTDALGLTGTVAKEVMAGALEGFEASSIMDRTNEILEEIRDRLPDIGPAATATTAIKSTEPDMEEVTVQGFNVKAALEDSQASMMQQVDADMAASKLQMEADLQKSIKEQLDTTVKPNVADDSQGSSGSFFKPSEGGILSDLPNLETTRAHLQGVASDMAKLGPEGAGPSQMMAGLATMTTAFDDTVSGSERIGAALSGLSSIVAGAAQNKVASIDKEIEAEKKRDGKSAGSIAKIKALEKKKEAVERKAFNTKKKLNMAQVITSTATAIMKESEKGFPAAIPGIAMFGAMGAAQLAVISGMTYQGGGSSASASAPSSVNVGERNNSVDLARGQNAGGELAYARGQEGIGTGMTDFKKPKGAFSGYKNRNAGGYIVGEQGPEVFMPETAGEIIPAGRIGGGEPTNVNFNISAVDATGVEDLLMNQRGNIIGMIREAANEHGEFFLESVQEKSY